MRKRMLEVIWNKTKQQKNERRNDLLNSTHLNALSTFRYQPDPFIHSLIRLCLNISSEFLIIGYYFIKRRRLIYLDSTCMRTPQLHNMSLLIAYQAKKSGPFPLRLISGLVYVAHFLRLVSYMCERNVYNGHECECSGYKHWDVDLCVKWCKCQRYGIEIFLNERFFSSPLGFVACRNKRPDVVENWKIERENFKRKNSEWKIEIYLSLDLMFFDTFYWCSNVCKHK